MLKIHSIETFGTHEGPGIRLVIFTQGCNFRCLYCENADTQEIGGGREIDAKEIIGLLQKEKSYFNGGGGLTVSGGEPTVQAKELLPIFKAVKEAGFNTALDTNGSITTETVEKLYEYTDLVLLDVKHIDQAWHKKITGVGNTSVLEMARFREKQGKPMWLRYVLVPGYSDQEEYLHKWGEVFQEYSSIDRVEILPYHTLGAYKFKELGRTYPLEGVPSPTKEQIEKAKEIFQQYFEHVYIR